MTIKWSISYLSNDPGTTCGNVFTIFAFAQSSKNPSITEKWSLDYAVPIFLPLPFFWNSVYRIIQICSTMFSFFRFWPEIPILGKFRPKTQHCLLTVKFGAKTNTKVKNSVSNFVWLNSNMQDLMVIFFFFWDWRYPFWANLVQKTKIISLRWTLVIRLIRVCRYRCSLFCFWLEIPLSGKLGPKVQYCPKWNWIPRLIWICRIQWWCTFYLFWTGNTLFGQIWSKRSKLFTLEFGTKTNLNIQNSKVMFIFSTRTILFGGIFSKKSELFVQAII